MPAAQAVLNPAPRALLQYNRLGPVLGAEVSGLDLKAPLDEATVQELRDALYEHKVLVIRNQGVTYDEHIRFGRYFGELEGHPVTTHVPDYPEILHIEAGDGLKLTDALLPWIRPGNKWHTDVTFREKPSLAGVLRARKLPQIGGDTLFADTAAVFKDLPPNVQARLETLEAEHDIIHSFGWRITDEKREELRKEYPPQIHPVVRRHPVTGEKHLFVNFVFTTRIIGLSEDESRELLNYLYDRVKVPEYQVRVKWSPNTITVWDNMATQHYAILDYWPAERVMERVTVAGFDRPGR